MKIPIFLMFQDKFEWTSLCVEYLRKNTNMDDFHLVLINNGSNSLNLEKVKRLMGDSDSIVDFESPVSVPLAYREAITRHVGESCYFFILHNDCFVSSGWAERMISCANESYGNFSVVFPRTNYNTEQTAVKYDVEINESFLKIKKDNRKKSSKESIEKTIEETYIKFGGFESYAKKIREDNYGASSISDEICYFCALYSVENYNLVGGFDTDFINHSGESKLYNYKSMSEDMYPLIAMDCYVHHNGNTTTDSFKKNFHKDRKESDDMFMGKVFKIENEHRDILNINTKINNNNLSIAIIRDDGLGDIIMSSFAVQGMMDKYPNLNISLYTNSGFVGFASGLECYSKVIPISNDFDLKYIEKTYDIVFDFRKFFERTNIEDYDIHRVDQVLNHIRSFYSKSFSSISASLPNYRIKAPNNKKISEAINDGDEVVAIAPDGTCLIRSIPKKVYSKIVEIESRSKKVLILGKDKVILNLENIKSENVINLSGETNAEDLPYLISRCKYIYTPDSGCFHIAGMLGVPTVAFFGSIDPSKRDGYYPSSSKNVILFKKELPCAPCWDVGCSHISCMKYSDQEIEKIISGVSF